ncbi:DUF4856 domain-containing protein [Flavobacterium humi]|uniref:DUF4856 domain-containing protein n=1 Tax=Flavobacterium humi TaxID=2562683 RepID=A0A4Z0L8S3_9FLAO|nr:DUF4856 domain-containing protein [Flavobacterium humi]TGD58005.1 DUF4856 domain-containing protein [Flavobacterium humi]
MKFKNVLLAALPVLMLTFASCSDNNDEPQGEQITVLPYTVPTTYEFSRNTATSVGFEDQNTRLKMLTEIGSYVGSGTTTPLTASKLTDMYANTNAQFTTVTAPVSINLKDKTATSIVYFNGGNSESTSVQNVFQGAFTDAVAASQTGAVAAAGVAGLYTPATGSKRLFAANGLEPAQVIQKGMMGAHMMDQVLNNFLSVTVLDAANNRLDNANKVLVAGKNYTEMEHAWDQAYGYIYGLDSGTTVKFWSSYINQVSAQTAVFNSLKTDILNAFIKGRAAITGNDYAVRDQQIAIIKASFSKVAAIRGVHYLQEGKTNLANGMAAFHGLSEGYGFIMSLRYTNNPATNLPYFTKAEVDVMLGKLNGGTASQPGLWDVDHLGAKIDEISTQVANKFGFTVADAAQG